MAIDRRTLEGIESCRPGSDDLQSPELADVARAVRDDPQAQSTYARVQKSDAAIRAAMEQVPVPVGLAARIVTALAADALATSSASNGAQTSRVPSGTILAGAVSAAQQVEHAEDQVVATSRPSRRAWSRRDWLAIGAAMAATVVVAVGVQKYLDTGDDAPLDALADRWLSELGPTWHDMQQMPKGFVVPAAITAEATGWQAIGRTKGVAYRLVHATAGTAQLFVVRMATNGLPVRRRPRRSRIPADARSAIGKAVAWCTCWWLRGTNATSARLSTPRPCP